ncbi:hypothetical protein GGI07_003681 [Coemansia sp. Benny D115]|nr:hypothetical protein GGI07_003681 [Coemansia sp. Benny D115]
MLSPDLPLTNVETAEWGNPLDNPADYRYISQYAPYDNIKEAGAKRQAMPSILVTAGGQDRRVSVWQPAKWVARLRSRGGYSESVKSVGDSLEAKLLFMASMNAGHFHSSSKSGEDGLDFIHAHALRNAFLIAETKQ